MDNDGTHKHAKVRAWLEEQPRFHLHFIPTSSSWLNRVERWFAELTSKAVRRGSFQSVPDLIEFPFSPPRLPSRRRPGVGGGAKRQIYGALVADSSLRRQYSTPGLPWCDHRSSMESIVINVHGRKIPSPFLV